MSVHVGNAGRAYVCMNRQALPRVCSERCDVDVVTVGIDAGRGVVNGPSSADAGVYELIGHEIEMVSETPYSEIRTGHN